ncbi:actin-like protein ARP6 [Phlyctochytrium arcticum]|nr:actin-like protein ARP6 [Phlyctochytrium arcticum]
MSKLLLLDNGAFNIKAGIPGIPSSLSLYRNGIAKNRGGRQTYVGDQIFSAPEVSGLQFRSSFEKGYLNDWGCQRDVWERILNNESLSIDPSDTTLTLTEPYFNFPNIRRSYDEVVFEEYGFAQYFRTSAAALSAKKDTLEGKDCTLVVDSGHSHTHIIPTIGGEPVWEAVKRIDVGGKLLTNCLKEAISFRQWDMMNETMLINEIKERCCFVSSNFSADLKRTKALDPALQLKYVLPNSSISSPAGFVLASETEVHPDWQLLELNNERFTVPELLFHPSDIGIDQAGLAEAIVQSVKEIEIEWQGLMYSNILLTGGCMSLPGVRERLETALRSMAPCETPVRVKLPQRPATCAWEYGSQWITNAPEDFEKNCVTREEYMENGPIACEYRFHSGRTRI